MSKIQVKYDPTIKQTEIVVPLTNSSVEEAGDNYVNNQPEIQQTSVYGIQAPLIQINNIVVDFTDVVDFNLRSIYTTPDVTMIVRDRYNLSSTIDTPHIDNELRIQILPKFDNKYRKINLTFYITSIKIDNGFVTIKAVYKLKSLTESQIKSFGEIGASSLCDTIAKNTGLGLATNIDNDNNKRFVYCDNKSYQDILNREVKRFSSQNKIIDWWIDWWNNLVLSDIYERYNAIDPQDELMIWIAGQNKEVSEGNKIEPILAPAILNNHPANQTSELFVSNYQIVNKPSAQFYLGTDKILSAYDHSKLEYFDYLIQDGDAQKDIFIKTEYIGENYSNVNYLLSEKMYDGFIQKIKSNETIEVYLNTPLLGVMRGNKVNFTWYINDSMHSYISSNLRSKNITNDIRTNVPMDDSLPPGIEDKTQDGQFEIDKSISGQYLITGCEMGYSNKKWKYKLILSRPLSMKPKIINENE